MLVYVLKGGLTSAIYTEVLQFFMIVLGFAPVVYLGLKDVGGWGAMNDQLAGRGAESRGAGPEHASSVPAPMPGPAPGSRCWAGPAPTRWAWTGSRWSSASASCSRFGYWCTNFLVVQRAMAAKNMTAARNTPLVAAVPKMLFPVLVIVPGMIAVALTAIAGQELPHPAADHRRRRVYAKAVDAVRSRRNPADPAAAVKAVGDALGKKVNAGQSRRPGRSECRQQA